ncbi:MAG: hypothetical protein ABFD50_23715 [Smithella sp.]
MKHIFLSIELSDELGIKSVTLSHNDTGLKSDSELVKMVAYALLKAYTANKEDVMIQDLLNEVGIPIVK